MYFNKVEATESNELPEKNYAGYVVISIAFVALIVLAIFPNIIGL